MRGRTALVAAPRRFFSETSIVITCCLRAVREFELLGFGVAQRTHGGLDRLSKVGQHGGVPGVGLGQLPSSPGEVPHLARVDDDHRQCLGGQSSHQR